MKPLTLGAGHLWVPRASHRYREVTGSNPVEVLNFQASLRNCKNCVHNCDDHSFTWFHIRSSYMIHFIYHFHRWRINVASRGFEPMFSAMSEQCSTMYQPSCEVTQLGAGQFVGFPRKGPMNEKNAYIWSAGYGQVNLIFPIPLKPPESFSRLQETIAYIVLISARITSPFHLLTRTSSKIHLSYDPYGPARAFIAKLLRKSPYEGRTRWREQGRKKPSGPARIAYGPHTGIFSIVLQWKRARDAN